jgi:hypothetical protein
MSTDQAEAERPLISPALERELFIKFWTWLAVVGLVLVPVTTGIATLAVQFARTVVSQDIDALKTRVLEIQSMSDKALNSTAVNQGKAEGAAQAAVDQLTHLKQVVAIADQATISVQDTQAIIGSLATNPKFIGSVSDVLKLAGTPKSFPEVGEFTIGDNIFAQVAEFPICTISKIDISRPVLDRGASCALTRQGGNWNLFVATSSFCRVTCFK